MEEGLMQKLYTVRLLTELFHRHPNTIYRWITEDHLFPHAFRVKDGWYVPERDVRSLITVTPPGHVRRGK